MMIRYSRRATIAGALALTAVPRVRTPGVRGQNPREDRTQAETQLGQVVSWQPPWHLRVDERYPGYADTILLETDQAQFAFVIHDRSSLPPSYQTPRGYRDSLIENPDLWNLDVLSVFADVRGAHALVVGQDTDRVFYYCVQALGARHLLELGLYAGIDEFAASWASAGDIELDGQPVYAGFDEASVLDPVDARRNADAGIAPEETQRAYLVAMWAFCFEMRASTEQVHGARRQADSAKDAIAAIAPYVASWDESIQTMQDLRRPGPEFDQLDSLARTTAELYTAAAQGYETVTEERNPAGSMHWAGFLDQLALAEGQLEELKEELARWEIPALTA